MNNEPAARKLPLALIVPVSVAIGVHLFIVVIHSLAAQSGPWPTPDGNAQFGPPPRFALDIDNVTSPYLRPLQMTHNYHFFSNRIYEVPSVQLDVVLKDKNGRTVQTLKYPDPEASLWVRHRQTMLAQALFDDRPGPRPGAPLIYPPGAAIPRLFYWEPPPEPTDDGTDPKKKETAPIPKRPSTREGVFTMKNAPENELPRIELFVASDWSAVLARSYARYILSHQAGAASAEIIRTSRPPIFAIMPRPENQMKANFGDGRPRR